MDALDPALKEADLILTPNPGLIEAQPGIERVWGKEIVFNHVPLTRQDLEKAAAGSKPTEPAVSVKDGTSN